MKVSIIIIFLDSLVEKERVFFDVQKIVSLQDNFEKK